MCGVHVIVADTHAFYLLLLALHLSVSLSSSLFIFYFRYVSSGMNKGVFFIIIHTFGNFYYFTTENFLLENKQFNKE